MSRMSSDRRRLEELRHLHQCIKAIEMPVAMAHEVDHVLETCIAAAAYADKFCDKAVGLFSLMLAIYAYIKAAPAADDG
jgi:hypothetical protein